MKTLNSKYIFLVLSFAVVAWGQPASVPFFGILSAWGGYALFWKSLPKQKSAFLWAFFWFSAVSAVQLSWMATAVYHGSYIYGVYAFLLIFLALEFALFTLLVVLKPLTYKRIVLLSAVWVLFEWSRLFWFSGFSWNPVGLAWGSSIYTLQVASIGGVYGLSFLFVFCNLCLLKAWQSGWFKRDLLIFCVVAVTPFLYGAIQFHYNEYRAEKVQKFSKVILVQTAISPGEKMGYPADPSPMLHPLDQWFRVLELLKMYYGKSFDLVVFPEGAFPYGNNCIYTIEQAHALLVYCFGSSITKYFPQEESQEHVGNGYIAQTLANAFNASLIVGLEETDLETGHAYNAAFLFSPTDSPKRYEKRILVPMGEYIPFEWAKALARNYGIEGSFSSGSKAKVFNQGVPLSITICYEETYGNLVREGRLLGAELFVNITNDNWFPGSALPLQHSEHARLRSVENGVPLIRAANTGITIAIDSMGQTIARLGNGRGGEWDSGALCVSVPTYTYRTLYLLWGDFFIIGLSFAFVGVYFTCFLLKIVLLYLLKFKI